MTLRYGLIPNHLTDDPNDYMGVVTNNETVTVESIVEQMIGKGSTVTKAEALSVIEEFEYAVVEAVKNGNSVNTELFRITPSISGVFADQSDGFDPMRHAIRLNLNAGSRLTEAISDIELRKVEISSPQPMLQQFIDLKTNVVNESFTAGQIASIRGSLLKFDTEDPKQGIFFIASDGTETRIENVVKNKPSELLFFIPESLSSGSFTVEVRTVLQNTKTIRKGILPVDLVPTS
ncbi:DNA-binding domain-containing protein [Marinifilum fragile]|uniref:DNA-binding domain-containing protein n=1 Tax=Marinifilum fragile TaxID=570161 RepID=UPI002AA6F71C|nr:DNA-binding domain-containing protein [Marinifilum fragile]